jgi:histone chaperone ASF1
MTKREKTNSKHYAIHEYVYIYKQDNPQYFQNPLQFEIQYECLTNLQHDLEWKLTYVGSAESDQHDQILDTVLVGPVARGAYKFVFQANPPDSQKIPNSDILGVTALLLTCSYQQNEFVRVGYYVNNEYNDEELRENPPSVPKLEAIVRNILAEKPRVTRFPCEFDAVSIPTEGGNGEMEMMMQQEEITTEGFGNENQMMMGYDNGNVVSGGFDGGPFDQQQQQMMMDPASCGNIDSQQQQQQPTSQPLW